MVVSTMDKKDVVPYVKDLLRDFDIGLQSITIMRPEKSGGSYVYTVIGMWSDDTEEPRVSSCLEQLMNIFKEITQDG